MTKEELLEKLKVSAMKHFDVEGFLKDMLHEVLDPALEEFVANTENSYDDMLVGALWPSIENELDKLIGKILPEGDEPVSEG